MCSSMTRTARTCGTRRNRELFGMWEGRRWRSRGGASISGDASTLRKPTPLSRCILGDDVRKPFYLGSLGVPVAVSLGSCCGSRFPSVPVAVLGFPRFLLRFSVSCCGFPVAVSLGSCCGSRCPVAVSLGFLLRFPCCIEECIQLKIRRIPSCFLILRYFAHYPISSLGIFGRFSLKSAKKS
jgi:hypothetical protein